MVCGSCPERKVFYFEFVTQACMPVRRGPGRWFPGVDRHAPLSGLCIRRRDLAGASVR